MNLSIHALRMESDLLDKLQHIRRKKRLSIHALRMESDTAAGKQKSKQLAFYPRSPHGERPFIFLRVASL